VRPLILLALVGTAVAPVAAGQGKNPKCGDAYHYRWKQKTDASLANESATAVTLTDVVNTWAAAALPATDWCADRVGNELHVYSVVGWVRVFRHEPDTDWHIELTATANGSIKQCMIAEIPRAHYSPLFTTARQDFTAFIKNSTVDSTGHVKAALQLRFTGAAFFDGWHLTHGKHGDCNVQPGGLWELHPVFKVEKP
jgi:hypothetical protein